MARRGLKSRWAGLAGLARLRAQALAWSGVRRLGVPATERICRALGSAFMTLQALCLLGFLACCATAGNTGWPRWTPHWSASWPRLRWVAEHGPLAPVFASFGARSNWSSAGWIVGDLLGACIAIFFAALFIVLGKYAKNVTPGLIKKEQEANAEALLYRAQWEAAQLQSVVGQASAGRVANLRAKSQEQEPEGSEGRAGAQKRLRAASRARRL